MDVTVIVPTFGPDPGWQELAARAAASAVDQAEVIGVHADTLAAARNLGAQDASTEWLCFLDADDELAPDYMAAMAAGTADLRGPAVAYVRAGRRRRQRLWAPCDLRDANHLVIGTLIRREMFHDVGGFLQWPMYEDWCLWQRCARAGATVEPLPAAVYVAHVRADSRNRAPGRAEKLDVHDRIRRHNHPELYEPTAVVA